MTKHKRKIISKHPLQRRSTFKKHTDRYKKVYHPYLPAIVMLALSLGLLFAPCAKSNKAVLGYATQTSPQSLLEQTNNQREANNLNDLNLNDKLSQAAQAKAQDMASRDYWSHVTPDGKQPWSFISQTGYSYSSAAENLAYGFNSSKDTVKGWMNSPPHRLAMLDNSIRDVGFGIANAANYQNHGPETIIVAMYANPLGASIGQVKSQKANSKSAGISFGQMISNKYPAWMNFIGGIAIGLISMYLIISHSVKIRRKIRDGERYIIHHPAIDLSLLSLIILLAVLSRTVGFVH